MLPTALRQLVDLKIVGKLPGADVNGVPVLLIRFSKYQYIFKTYYIAKNIGSIDATYFLNADGLSSSGATLEELYLVIIIFLEEITRTNTSAGVALIIDWSGFDFPLYRQISLRNLRRGFSLFQVFFVLIVDTLDLIG